MITPEERYELMHVGPGTLSGEVFRRYWLPVEVSANLGGGAWGFAGARNPLRVRVLGEDLVLFRDGSGKPGLLAEHCSHRGTSLFYGRVEESCLRCLYHGWAYDREGNVVDMPAEPPAFRWTDSGGQDPVDSMGLAAQSGIRNPNSAVKHTAYPCIEVAGLIFAYMGPPDKTPPFPRYEELFRVDGVRITGNGGRIQRSNAFLQTLDNVLDVWHRDILHGWFKGVTPRTSMHWGSDGEPPTPIKYERTPWGTCYVVLQRAGRPGVYQYHETHAVWPCQRLSYPRTKGIKWAVPIDDHVTRWFGVDFTPFVDGKAPPDATQSINDPFLSDGRANVPDDWVEQVGHWWNVGHTWRQGPIWEDEVAMGSQGVPECDGLPDLKNWHLATCDRGLMFNWEVWQEQVERVRQGLDPLGIVRGKSTELIRVPAAQLNLSWDEGLRLFNMSVEERVEALPPLSEETRARALAGAASVAAGG